MNTPEFKTTYTAAEIRKAVDQGKTVYAGSGAYEVFKDSNGEYLIKCTLNNSFTGLTGMQGTKYEDRLNMSKFAIVEP